MGECDLYRKTWVLDDTGKALHKYSPFTIYRVLHASVAHWDGLLRHFMQVSSNE